MTTDLVEPAAIGAYDAKTRLAQLLDRVAAGEQFVITRHGRPVARLIPEPGGPDRARARAAVAGIAALRQGIAARLSDTALRALREEGRR